VNDRGAISLPERGRPNKALKPTRSAMESVRGPRGLTPCSTDQRTTEEREGTEDAKRPHLRVLVGLELGLRNGARAGERNRQGPAA
jgi:hypothetical protein